MTSSTFKNFRIDGTEVQIEEDLLDSEYLRESLETGDYEREERDLISGYLTDYGHLDVIELGAGIGVVSMAIDRELSSTHVAVEPDPRNVEILKRTRDVNGGRFEICRKAYEPEERVVDLLVSEEFWNSAIDEHQYLHKDKEITVPAISLEQIRHEYGIDDFVLVCDIEGAEELLLEEREVMQDCQLAIVEIHQYEDQQLQTQWFSDTFNMEFMDRIDNVVVCARTSSDRYTRK